MFDEYLKHLRQEPIDHRLTVKTKCGVQAVILLTTDKIERADCIPCLQAAGVQPKTPKPQPETPAGKEPRMPNTMAEAFCEEHLMTWTEHGEDFTDWRDGDTDANLDRMRQAGAVTLFEPMEKDGCFMIVTVFQDRSWIVQQEPPSGAPPVVGTGDDEHRIPDLIHILESNHQTLETGQKREQKPEPPEFPAHLDTQGNEHAEF